MSHEIGKKREQQMRLVAQIAAQRPAHAGLDGFQLGPEGERFIFAHDRDRRQKAVLAVLRDLRVGQ